ncbi:G-protein coupled receptor [Biomphalaria glabrata]|nr:G-protein coupled receptor [Biomphalaria glabrata]
MKYFNLKYLNATERHTSGFNRLILERNTSDYLTSNRNWNFEILGNITSRSNSLPNRTALELMRNWTWISSLSQNETDKKRFLFYRENKFPANISEGCNRSKYIDDFDTTVCDTMSKNRVLLQKMVILFSEMANQFQFLYFVMSRSVYQVMMNSFSVFYFDQLAAKVSEATSVQFRSMLALINSSHNETKRYSNPCHAYIFSILSSSTGLLRNLKYYVNPTLATLGLCQNILCIVVLNKDGFSKTSNLNLLSVIVAGSFQQLLSINIAEILEFDSGVDMYEAVSEVNCAKKINLVFQTLKNIFLFLGTWGQYVFFSTFLLITIERFLVVFLPLTFKTYVKKKCMVACLCIIFLMWLPFVLFKIICLHISEISLTLYSTQPLTMDISWMRVCYYHSKSIAITILVVSKLIPLFLVLLGSVVIAIRIKIILNKRSKLTNLPHKLSWSKQTTKVLLATCLLFSISDALQYILSYVAVHFVQDPDIGFLLHSEFIYFSYLLTSCSTFFIFISTNKRLLHHCTKFIQSFQKVPQTVVSST